MASTKIVNTIAGFLDEKTVTKFRQCSRVCDTICCAVICQNLALFSELATMELKEYDCSLPTKPQADNDEAKAFIDEMHQAEENVLKEYIPKVSRANQSND